MTRAIRTPRIWQIRLAGAVLLLVALLTGQAGHTLAYPYHDDDDDGEEVTIGLTAQPDDDDDNEVVTTGPNACTTILPPYPNATCTRHETEQDDGVTETKNYYLTQDAADTVRRAYEAVFRVPQNGWTLVATEYDQEDQEWEYTVTQGQRRVQVTIEARRPAAGGGTEIEIEE